MGKVIADQSLSLDGFSTGPNVGVGNGMGDGGEQLHDWMFSEGDGAAINAGVREDTPFVPGRGKVSGGGRCGPRFWPVVSPLVAKDVPPRVTELS